jgi:Mrp family chromosome partitioning ATPase
VPYNPTELLCSQKFEQLIQTVRSLYDIIVIDSPSAGMLADADIIGKYVDCKLFVVRAGVFKRSNLEDLKPIHHDDKQQYVILNGVSIDSRYGFEYAHKYDRSERMTKSWTNKIKKILH